MRHLNTLFVTTADWVSAAMGTPVNILLWLVLVGAWFVLFATNPGLQHTSFLPAWFTSNSFNFPLNTVTTLAELWIGFLVAAASNRVEKHTTALLTHIDATAAHEEHEIAVAAQRLLTEDSHIEAILAHLDKQDALILHIAQRLDTALAQKTRG